MDEYPSTAELVREIIELIFDEESLNDDGESNEEQNDESKVCSLCNNAFKSKNSAKVHMSDVHASENSRKCNFCQYIFSSITSRKKHMKKKHKSNVSQ